MKSSVANIIVAVLICFCVIFVNCRSINDDIAIMRQRATEMANWPTQTNLSSIVDLAKQYSETMNSSCYWQDINYYDKTLATWATEEHLIRVNYLLQALTIPGSSLQNDSKLSNLTHCALNVWLVRDFQNPNWWFNQIGIPLLITSQLLMLGDNATAFETQKIVEISYRSDWWSHDPGTGANLVWMLQIELYRSLATNNKTGITESIDRMWRDVTVLDLGGQGIQTDWSYHFHGSVLYSAGYGQDWAVAIIVAMASARGTQYEASQQQLTTFANFLTKGDAWMMNDNIWDWGTQGRAIDRPGTVFASLGFEVQPDWIRSLAEAVQDENLKKDLMNYADRLDKKPDAVPLIGNKHLYVSDFHVHRRVNWTSALKMQSVRTTPTECINLENQKAENVGQGVLNLYTNNATIYRNIFPLLDWQAINGITVEHDIPLEKCYNGHFQWKQFSFVGAASDGQYGVAAMDTGSHNLTVLRSWHFYDEAIVALASNLTVTTRTTPWTTLASRFLAIGTVTIGFFNGTTVTLNDGINYTFPYVTNKLSNNVQWIHLSENNIAYLLQTQGVYSSVGAEVSTKSASYSTIGPYNETVTGRTVTVWLDHGVGPYTRDYSYMIVPNVDVQSLPQIIQRYESENIFSCFSNNLQFHGVAWSTIQRASFVLWNGTPTKFTCQSSSFKLTAEIKSSGIYLFNETSTEFSVTVSHPIVIGQSLTVNVDRVGFGTGCTALSDSSTDVTIPLPTIKQYLGSSVTVTCKKRQ